MTAIEEQNIILFKEFNKFSNEPTRNSIIPYQQKRTLNF